MEETGEGETTKARKDMAVRIDTVMAATGAPGLYHWKIVVDLIQAAFREGQLAE